MTFRYEIELLSDASFGRGSGISGHLDQELDHDEATGLPEVDRAVKGLLVQSCGQILYALKAQGCANIGRLESAAAYLFGSSGGGQGALRFSVATVERGFEQYVHDLIERNELTSEDVLASLSTIIHRTSVAAKTGRAEDGSLRATRALKRHCRLGVTLELEAPDESLKSDALALLDACVKHCRRGGLRRHRGSGKFRGALRASEPAAQASLDHAFETFKGLIRE